MNHTMGDTEPDPPAAESAGEVPPSLPKPATLAMFTGQPESAVATQAGDGGWHKRGTADLDVSKKQAAKPFNDSPSPRRSGALMQPSSRANNH
jgi:hypothetical protein